MLAARLEQLGITMPLLQLVHQYFRILGEHKNRTARLHSRTYSSTVFLGDVRPVDRPVSSPAIVDAGDTVIAVTATALYPLSCVYKVALNKNASLQKAAAANRAVLIIGGQQVVSRRAAASVNALNIQLTC